MNDRTHAANRDPVRRLRAAGVPPRFVDSDFDCFFPLNPSQEAAYVFARFAADAWRARRACDPLGIFFVGPPGVGKTHLAAAGLRELVLAGGRGYFCSFHDVLLALTCGSEDDDRRRQNALKDRLRSCDALVVDDVCGLQAYADAADVLTDIITSRHKTAKPTSFIATTEAPVLDVATYLDRTFGRYLSSRLHEMCRIIPVVGDDYRVTIRAAANRYSPTL